MQDMAEDLAILTRQLGQAINHCVDALEAIAKNDPEELRTCLRGVKVQIDLANRNAYDLVTAIDARPHVT